MHSRSLAFRPIALIGILCCFPQQTRVKSLELIEANSAVSLSVLFNYVKHLVDVCAKMTSANVKFKYERV